MSDPIRLNANTAPRRHLEVVWVNGDRPTSPSRARKRSRRLLRPVRRGIALGGLVAFAAGVLAGSAATASAAPGAPATKPTIVLVHGAFADSSGWDGEIDRLSADGYPVIAAPNPLRGVASDAAVLRGILSTISGPVVLVGHSYGGEVITNAAVGNPNVKALVYVAAFAPDAGESQIDIATKFPGALLGPATIIGRPYPLPDGTTGVDQYINPASFRDVFAADEPAKVAARMAAEQRPLALAASLEKSGTPAWKTIPSWYLVANQDHAISPAAERFMASRAKAHTQSVNSAHDVMVSHPSVVTKLIESAAKATS